MQLLDFLIDSIVRTNADEIIRDFNCGDVGNKV